MFHKDPTDGVKYFCCVNQRYDDPAGLANASMM